MAQKKLSYPVLLLLLACTISSCGQSVGRASNNTTAVEDILSAQIEGEIATVESTEENSTEEIVWETVDAQDIEDSEIEVDYDLSTMSRDMVYATVYQMMCEPEEFIGKTVRMSGMYNVLYYDSTDTYYHYCVIADAAACCTQGIEFVWGKGEHSYPEEYPREYSSITVVGTFEVYEEEGLYYCRLQNSLLVIEE